MRNLLLIAASFSLIGCASITNEVDGNSFYCKPMDSSTSSHLAYKFENNKVFSYNESGQEFSFYYQAWNNFVSWSIGDVFGYDMSRKTLQLKFYSSDYIVLDNWQCDFMEINQARKLVVQVGKLRDEKAREGNKF